MNYQVKVNSSAEKDIDKAMDWYEKQQEGLGTNFLLKFYAAAFLKETQDHIPKCISHFGEHG
jgi:hypothetical protein